MRNYMKTRKKKTCDFSSVSSFFYGYLQQTIEKENYENNIFYLSHVLRCFLCAGTRQ